MSRLGGSLVFRAVLVSVALLLPAGVVSAVVVDPPSTTAAVAPSASVGATTTSTSTSSTITAVLVSTLPAPASSTTTTRRPVSSTTATPTTKAPLTSTSTSRVSVPPRPGPVRPTIPAASSWQAEKDGISLRLHIDPPSPVVGQAVRFTIDVSTAKPCCILTLRFGDGVGPFRVNPPPPTCDDPSAFTTGTHTYATTHTFGSPWVYLAELGVVGGDPCENLTPGVASTPSSAPPSVSLVGCVAVGPPKMGQPESCALPVFVP